MVAGVLVGEDGHSLDTRRPDVVVNTGGRCDDSENRERRKCASFFLKHHRLIYKLQINVLLTRTDVCE